MGAEVEVEEEEEEEEETAKMVSGAGSFRCFDRREGRRRKKKGPSGRWDPMAWKGCQIWESQKLNRLFFTCQFSSNKQARNYIVPKARFGQTNALFLFY